MVSFKTIKHTIPKGYEFRIEISHSNYAHLTLLHGNVDIFGTSMEPGRKYLIQGQKIALFAFEKSVIGLEGKPDVIYKSEDTLMLVYMKIHEVLEERRTSAKMAGSQGPRVLCVGPVDSGKTTVIRILCNLATRMDWIPTMVELNITQGNIAMPGTVSAAVLDEPWKIEEGLDCPSPLVFYRGYTSYEDEKQFYKATVERLATILDIKAGLCNMSAAAGIYIDTMGCTEEKALEPLLHQIESFSCDVVLVLGQDKLYHQLLHYKSKLSESRKLKLELVKLPCLGGVVSRSMEFRKQDKNYKINKYFKSKCGSRASTLPTTAILSTIDVYGINSISSPKSALPIGAIKLHRTPCLRKINMSSSIEGTILAISHGTTPEEASLASIAGFVQVLEVNTEKNLIAFRTPTQNMKPGKIFICEKDLKFSEHLSYYHQNINAIF
eukprot:gnl/TRDRNA2_/TRDRNA2_177718_c2_seq1.p1 gnl/TRDRNA2_/TRDRNA2_177718_c2~~gnl/TRDRNA2_/TRDRNA2_177718_c2_seq1.p1  ORF type:complete len:438 (-),score=-24.34 gnl/TRDRNA2_/TRDRNA2_177718_c2_seq1:8-1321(-)